MRGLPDPVRFLPDGVATLSRSASFHLRTIVVSAHVLVTSPLALATSIKPARRSAYSGRTLPRPLLGRLSYPNFRRFRRDKRRGVVWVAAVHIPKRVENISMSKPDQADLEVFRRLRTGERRPFGGMWDRSSPRCAGAFPIDCQVGALAIVVPEPPVRCPRRFVFISKPPPGPMPRLLPVAPANAAIPQVLKQKLLSCGL